MSEYTVNSMHYASTIRFTPQKTRLYKHTNKHEITDTLTSPPPGTCLMLSLDPIFGFAFSLKSNLTDSIFLSPPLGLCAAFSKEPIFDFALQANFCC